MHGLSRLGAGPDFALVLLEPERAAGEQFPARAEQGKPDVEVFAPRLLSDTAGRKARGPDPQTVAALGRVAVAERAEPNALLLQKTNRMRRRNRRIDWSGTLP